MAALSRGYKRKSKGYILATAESSAGKIGDEPYQIKSKFPDIRVAVDEDRCHGIEQLLKLKNPAVDAVLLDDALPTPSCESRSEHSADRLPPTVMR